MKKLFVIALLILGVAAFSQEENKKSISDDISDSASEIISTAIVESKKIDEEFDISGKVKKAGDSLVDWFNKTTEKTKEKVEEKSK